MEEHSLKFYFTKDKNGSPHHLVVATGTEEDGKVQVARVGFHADAAVKRGRPPKFAKPVEVSSLQVMADDDVTDEMRSTAFGVVGVDNTEVN